MVVRENPALVIESAIHLVRNVLAGAREAEREKLVLDSALASRIRDAVLAAIPHKSIEIDVRMAELLLAVANMCVDDEDPQLDMGLTIAGRSLLRRAFEIEGDTPLDILTRLDVFIVLAEGEWLTGYNADVRAQLQNLRHHLRRFIDRTGMPLGVPLRRDAVSQAGRSGF